MGDVVTIKLPRWSGRYLAALEQLPHVQRACKAAGVSRSTAYRLRAANKAFAEAWDQALETGIDNVESEAFRRGVDGFDEPVMHAGKLAYRVEPVIAEDGTVTERPILDERGQPVPLAVRRYSDHLLALVLQGRRKTVYGKRVELTSTDAGGDHSPADSMARAARAAQLLAAAAARRSEG